jgi:hypothetical protein
MRNELTIDDHRLLHEVFVDEAADLAPVGPAQLRRRTEDLQGPVFPPLVAAVHLVRLQQRRSCLRDATILSITTLSKTALSIRGLRVTLSIRVFLLTLSISDSQHK